MEIWAHCPSCERWYFVPADTIEAISAVHCPVCDEKPDHYENRRGESTFEVMLEGAPQ